MKITKENIYKEIKIINSFEMELKNKEDDYKYKNEKKIKENPEIKINGQRIEFTYYYKFEEEGKYIIEYIFKNNLTKTNYMFRGCNSLTNLNLSYFNTQNVTDMSRIFSICYSLSKRM